MKTIYSFSIKPTDTKSRENIKIIEKYMAKTSVKFSPVVLKALNFLVDDLERTEEYNDK